MQLEGVRGAYACCSALRPAAVVIGNLEPTSKSKCPSGPFYMSPDDKDVKPARNHSMDGQLSELGANIAGVYLE